eukprot:CAMPEP_0114658298 /NCGR_PEP_ID=MMETSP0191-20121206/15497_1 /TAXON_ID=126664 /ORGANISM="Sorites sp." /LENGTH=209 /DNA_ID=CAMNT_0001879959 /DNA_START=332 /DNA_END=958 /DNA_ORIENTATION=-
MTELNDDVRSQSVVIKDDSDNDGNISAYESKDDTKVIDSTPKLKESPLNWKFDTGSKTLRYNNKGELYCLRKSGTDPGFIRFGNWFSATENFGFKKIQLLIDTSECHLPGITGVGMVTDKFNEWSGTTSRLSTDYYVFLTGNGKYFNNNIDDTNFFYDIDKAAYKNRRELKAQYPKGFYARPKPVGGYMVGEKVMMEVEFSDKPTLKIW